MRTLALVITLMAGLVADADVLVVREYLTKGNKKDWVVRLIFPKEDGEICQATLKKEAVFLRDFMKEKALPAAKFQESSESEEEDPNAPVLCTTIFPQNSALLTAVLQNMGGFHYVTLREWDLEFKKRILNASRVPPKASKEPTALDLDILLTLFTSQPWTGHGKCKRFRSLAKDEENTAFEDDRFKPRVVSAALAYIDSIERAEQLAPIEEFGQNEYGWQHCIRKFKAEAKWDDAGSVYSMLPAIIDHIAAKRPTGIVRTAYVALLQQLLPVFFVKAANIRVMLDELQALNNRVPGLVALVCHEQKDYLVLDTREEASRLGAFGPKYDCGRGIFGVKRLDGNSTLVLGYNPEGFVHTDQKYRDLARAEEEAIQKLRNE